MKPLFVGSHPAIDFLNTTLAPDGISVELIGDGRSFVEWLVSAGLLHSSDAAKVRRHSSGKALDDAAAEARTAREWAGDWISRRRDNPNGNYEKEVRRLNGFLDRARCYPELVMLKGGLQVTQRYRINSADELIAPVVAQVALLVANEQAALVKRCAGPQCTLWFLDRTKAHRRLFCSAAACGNRAKVAAFRERQRAK